jgi:hypothetical protein
MFKYLITTHDGRRLYADGNDYIEAAKRLGLRAEHVKRSMPLAVVVPEEVLKARKEARLANLKAGRKKIAEERKLAKKIDERRKK